MFSLLSLSVSVFFFFFLQKMDKNRDGVVTIEEFIETCQKVTHAFLWFTVTRGVASFINVWGVRFRVRVSEPD